MSAMLPLLILFVELAALAQGTTSVTAIDLNNQSEGLQSIHSQYMIEFNKKGLQAK
jgi:hypothetical protein